jgi:hypothetical protein
LLKFELDLAVTIENLRHLIVREWIFSAVLQFRLEPRDFLSEFRNFAGGGFDFLKRGAAAHIAHILRKISDHQPIGNIHVSAVHALFTGNDPKDRCLAGAIGTDEPNLVARANLKATVFVEDTRAVLFSDARQVDHVVNLLTQRAKESEITHQNDPQSGCSAAITGSKLQQESE